MNKIEIAHELREQENIDKGTAEKIVEIFFDEIAHALIEGDRAEIRGFCSFAIKSYPSYTGRNPSTGENVIVEKKSLPIFRAGRELKSRVDLF